MKIIEERLRRNCESAITKYSQKLHEKQTERKIKTGKLNGMKVKPQLLDAASKVKMPINLANIALKEGKNGQYFLGGLEYNSCMPITMVVVQQPRDKKVKDRNEGIIKTEEKFKWPGVQEVMESYQRYTAGKQENV